MAYIRNDDDLIYFDSFWVEYIPVFDKKLVLYFVINMVVKMGKCFKREN